MRAAQDHLYIEQERARERVRGRDKSLLLNFLAGPRIPRPARVRTPKGQDICVQMPDLMCSSRLLLTYLRSRRTGSTIQHLHRALRGRRPRWGRRAGLPLLVAARMLLPQSPVGGQAGQAKTGIKSSKSQDHTENVSQTFMFPFSPSPLRSSLARHARTRAEGLTLPLRLTS